MRLSQQAQYAICGMFDLAYNGESSPVQVRVIGERQRIPPRYLELERLGATVEPMGGGQTEKRTSNEALRSLRNTIVEIEEGDGLLHDLIYEKKGGELLGSLDRTVKTLERMAQAIETERGLLHALIYTPAEESFGRVTRIADRLDTLLAEAKQGPGLLHALIYDPQGAEILARVNRTSERLDELIGAIHQGQGLVPTLLFDAQRGKVLDDLQAAVASLRTLSGDLQVVAARLRQGDGTLGALLDDPTVYEDLSALLRGANRSLLMSVRSEGTPIHLDMHSLSLGVGAGNERFRRPVPEWRRWAFTVETVQMNEEEITGMCSEPLTRQQIAGHLLTLGVKGVIVTRGAEGAAVYYNERKLVCKRDVAPVTVPDVQDTTGCGDVFGAAFLAQYLKSHEPATATEFANRAAASVVGEIGSRRLREALAAFASSPE